VALLSDYIPGETGLSVVYPPRTAVHPRLREGLIRGMKTRSLDQRRTAVPPSKQELIDRAKGNLATERLAFPPWADIEFEVYYP
jgi:hypothetical protein